MIFPFDDPKFVKLQQEYTDEDLLLELRRRGRFSRVDVENVAPDRYIKDGLTMEYQIEKAWKQFAQEAARLHGSGKIPVGLKVENVRGDGTLMPPYETGRRLKFAVNYVIEKRNLPGGGS